MRQRQYTRGRGAFGAGGTRREKTLPAIKVALWRVIEKAESVNAAPLLGTCHRSLAVIDALRVGDGAAAGRSPMAPSSPQSSGPVTRPAAVSSVRGTR